eukprot:g6904.t1
MTSEASTSLHLVGVAHVCLFAATAVPIFIPIPTEAIIVYTAVLAVYIGSWRSVKEGPPEEGMTKKDAMRFPVVGSVALATLFFLFKLLPKDLVNFALGIYFVLIGIVATTTTLLPLLMPYFPRNFQNKTYGPYRPRLPNRVTNWIPSATFQEKLAEFQGALEFSATPAELVVGSMCTVLCFGYLVTKHWLLNNFLGLAFAIEGIEYINITSTHTGILLFAGLFFYDIFWVFFTSVMVSVATAFNAPIKLMFPKPEAAIDAKQPYSILGLGDIVIPGIFISLVLRYDMSNHDGKPLFFTSAMTGYAVGLITTTVVMNVFNAAQPALLYIVPSVLGFVLVHATIKGEFWKFVNHCAIKDHQQRNDNAAKAVNGVKTD